MVLGYHNRVKMWFILRFFVANNSISIISSFATSPHIFVSSNSYSSVNTIPYYFEFIEKFWLCLPIRKSECGLGLGNAKI